MLSPFLLQTKVATRANLPRVAAAYRMLRQVPGDRRQFAGSDIVIECHDKNRPNSTAAMTGALTPTHVLGRVDASGRNLNRFPFLTDIHETDRWLAACENRPSCSHWLVCDSRGLPRA